MTSARYTSRVYAALKTVASELETLVFPALHGVVPKVVYGDPIGVQDGSRELIGVRMAPLGDVISWESMGPARRTEDFTIEVIIYTQVPGRSGGQVVDRLAELSAVVEGLLFDVTTKESTPINVNGVNNLSLVASVEPQVQATEEGYVGLSTISLLIRSRI